MDIEILFGMMKNFRSGYDYTIHTVLNANELHM